jgi:hypothetical protein
MKRKRALAALVGALTMTTAAVPAIAQTAPQPATAAAGRFPAAAKQAPRRARAWLALSAAQPKPWVGQAVPVTVTAFFRGVEGVTLEGIPQLASKGIITSDLAKDPHQSTEIIDGERTLVVRWTATITPSSSGPIDLSVELPVRIRYREAPPRTPAQSPRAPDPGDDDPFADLGHGVPFDSIFDRMRKRMQQQLEQPVGRVREESLALEAAARGVEARDLPTKDRPASFSGAVGQFDLDSSISATQGAVSDPLTVRIAVGGNVDLDRVDLPGITTSADWKAYPPRVVQDPPRKGLPPKKVFEQAIVPLHGGDLTVPPVSFTAFDPVSGTYVTRSTSPIRVAVDGASAAAAPAPKAAPETKVVDEPVPVVTPLHAGMRVLPVFLLVVAAALQHVVRKKRAQWALRRAMRRAASTGSVDSFLGSAHRFIATRLSERWGVLPDEITARSVHERLGPDAKPLIDVLLADEALRFGRGGLEGAELGPLCSSIERTLTDLREVVSRESRDLGGAT